MKAVYLNEVLLYYTFFVHCICHEKNSIQFELYVKYNSYMTDRQSS